MFGTSYPSMIGHLFSGHWVSWPAKLRNRPWSVMTLPRKCNPGRFSLGTLQISLNLLLCFGMQSTLTRKSQSLQIWSLEMRSSFSRKAAGYPGWGEVGWTKQKLWGQAGCRQGTVWVQVTQETRGASNSVDELCQGYRIPKLGENSSQAGHTKVEPCLPGPYSLLCLLL